MTNVKTIQKVSNGMEIEQGLCTCLKANIKIKLIGLYVDSTSTGSHVSITHNKVYELINKYGISLVGGDFFVIETPELKFYILSDKK